MYTHTNTHTYIKKDVLAMKTKPFIMKEKCQIQIFKYSCTYKCIHFNTRMQEDVLAMQKKPFSMKEKYHYQIQIYVYIKMYTHVYIHTGGCIGHAKFKYTNIYVHINVYISTCACRRMYWP